MNDTLDGMDDLVAAINADRRKSARAEYPTRQRVAFGKFDAIPPERWFVAVECRDVSRGGFSFYSDQPQADSSELVVELALLSQTVNVESMVVSCSPSRVPQKPPFVVGCRFIKRL